MYEHSGRIVLPPVASLSALRTCFRSDGAFYTDANCKVALISCSSLVEWAWDLMLTLPASNGLGLSINSDLLEAKALRMMKIARAALIQLALAIGVEERNKAAAAPIC